MDHILTRIKGPKIEEIKAILKADAVNHTKQGLMLRHIWRNADDPDEIVFIFTAEDLDGARRYIEAAHERMLKGNPDASMPTMLFLKGE